MEDTIYIVCADANLEKSEAVFPVLQQTGLSLLVRRWDEKAVGVFCGYTSIKTAV